MWWQVPKVPSSAPWFCILIWIMGGDKDTFFFFLIPYYYTEYIRVHIHCHSLLGWNAMLMHNQIRRNGPHPHFETQCTYNKEPLILLAICWGKKRPVTAPFDTLKLKGAFSSRQPRTGICSLGVYFTLICPRWSCVGVLLPTLGTRVKFNFCVGELVRKSQCSVNHRLKYQDKKTDNKYMFHLIMFSVVSVIFL